MERPHADNEALVTEIERWSAAAYAKVGAEIMDRVVDFAAHLREKYPDFARYRAYHKLIGSTPRAGTEFPEGDFPGEDSVVYFFRNIAES